MVEQRLWAWLSTAAIAAGLVMASGCCTMELRTAVRGSIVDSDGNPVVADSVTLSAGDQTEYCQQWGDGEYSCGEQGGGPYTLRAVVGDWDFEEVVDPDRDGCHDEALTRDIVVP